MSAPYYYKTSGRFYLGSGESSWQVVLYAPGGPVSELWPEDDEPDVDDMLPSDVLDLIEERLKSYWISTSREEKQKKINAMRETIEQADRDWVAARVEKARASLTRWEERLALLSHSEGRA